MPPAQAQPPGGAPAKTMFGYAAPVVARPGQPAAPPAPQSYGAPPAQPGYGAPPAQQGYGAPSAQPGYGAPPAQQGYGAPPAQQGYGAPPAQPGYGAPPAQQGYGAPPAQQGYGAPPAQQGYGAPQANPFAAPQQNLPGPLDNLARGLPQSQPGTIFGIPIARLRDADLQKKFLFLAGIALIASVIVPFTTGPMRFAWSEGAPKFEVLIWPIIAGGIYLLLTAAPPHVRANIPPIVLHWAPFAVALLGVLISKMGMSMIGLMLTRGRGEYSLGFVGVMYVLGYVTIIFGLLARIAQPQDQIARIVTAVGAGMLVPFFFNMFDFAFKFDRMPFMFVIHNLLWLLVVLLGVCCAVFVVKPEKLPPALQAVDALAPLVVAVLILWLPLQQVIFGLGMMMEKFGFMSSLLMMAHGVLPILAYFSILMMASPAAYEEAKAMFLKNNNGGGGQPPQGGGGYPPQGGGGYPPQGGGGYPPQGGGGWPQQ